MYVPHCGPVGSWVPRADGFRLMGYDTAHSYDRQLSGRIAAMPTRREQALSVCASAAACAGPPSSLRLAT
jgi:hypothetical protein